MDEQNTNHIREPLPPELYIGGFLASAQAAEMFIAHFGLTKPLRMYYPGSSSDASFLRLDHVQTMHADLNLQDNEIAGFASVGAEAHREDVHTWKPPGTFDIVTFINPTGIHVADTLRQTQLRTGGLVIWAMHSNARPWGLEEADQFHLAAVIDFQESGLVLHTDHLAEYFQTKPFAELTEEEVSHFTAAADYLRSRFNVPPEMGIPQIYDALLDEQNFHARFDTGYQHPYRRDGTFFAYQKSDSTQPIET